MRCPFCRHEDTKVSDSRVTEDGSAIRRRRMCPECSRKFTTMEQILLTVVKRSGVVEQFSRDKVIGGVSKACQGRPVTQAQLAELGQQVEESLRMNGLAEIPSEEIGVAILGPLAELDPVAYLRFASVYKNYESVDDFLMEISDMADRAEAVGTPARGPSRRSRRKVDHKKSVSQEPLIG